MSYDIPRNLERDVQKYADQESLSTSEATARLLTFGLESVGARKKRVSRDLVTDEQIEQLKALGVSGMLDGVPEGKIRRMEATIAKMKRERVGRSA